jgi:hypothetical protein
MVYLAWHISATHHSTRFVSSFKTPTSLIFSPHFAREMRFANAFLVIISPIQRCLRLTRSHIYTLAATNASNMPDDSLDNFENEEVNDPLRALLEALCPEDPDEANRRYLNLHQKLVGYFQMKGMMDPFKDADETLDRAGQKIAKGVVVPDINRFCLGIARNIVRERFRQMQHEESAFKQFIENYMDNSTEAVVDRIANFMKPCFERLPFEDRELLISYCNTPEGCSRAEHRLNLAHQLKSSISALRIRITRLRRVLEKCVKALRKRQ